MAGLGARLFPAFSKLTSDQVNGYLMDQTIMRFATTSARDAAFGGAGEPTLAEGMTAYIDADNSIYTYDGSNWVKMISTADRQAIGLWKVASGSFSGASVSAAVDIDNVFTNDFDNYRIIFRTLSSVSGNVLIQFRNTAGSIVSDLNYYNEHTRSYLGSVDAAYNNAANQSLIATQYGNSWTNIVIDMNSPNLASSTVWVGPYNTLNAGVPHSLVGNGGGMYFPSVQFRGLLLYPTSGTIQGDYSIYGYRK